MITIEQAFFNYYPKFVKGWVHPLMDVCQDKKYNNLLLKLNDFPGVDNMHLAMTRMELMVRLMANQSDIKSALIDYMVTLSDAEKKFILEDTTFTEQFKSWRRIFELMFFIK